MAISLRGFCRLNISLANNAFFRYNFINVGVRCMYTERDLGVLSYEGTRYVFHNQFVTIQNTFREKMREICQDQNGVIYTEDLKAMIHLAEATDDDMQLLNVMLQKYIQSQEKKFGRYIFGPVVMRMYYHLNQPQYALDVFNNDALKGSFEFRTSFRILLCLLYKNGMYKEMRETYQKVLTENGIDYIGSSNVLMYAGCLKENTLEALEYALNHWKLQYDNVAPSIRSCALLAYLAIKNNKPEIAVDVLSAVSYDRIMSIRALKILAYVHLGRYIQIIPILKHGLEQENNSKPYYFFADVIYELEDKLKTEDLEESKQLINLVEQAKKQNYIQTDFTLEEFLLRPMTFKKVELDKAEERKKLNNRRLYSTKQKSKVKNYV